MQIEKHLAMAVIGLGLASRPPTINRQVRDRLGPVRLSVAGWTCGWRDFGSKLQRTTRGTKYRGQALRSPRSSSAFLPAHRRVRTAWTCRSRTTISPSRSRSAREASHHLCRLESLPTWAWLSTSRSSAVCRTTDRSRAVARDRAAPQKRRHQALASRRERSDGRGDARAVG